MSIIDKIQTITDAYTARGLKREETIIVEPKNEFQEIANSFIDALVLTAALNEGREPNYADPKEERVSIWWYLRSVAAGGPGFSYHDCVYATSYSFVSARLVFFDWKVAKHAATKFSEVYKPFMTFPDKPTVNNFLIK